MAEGVLKARGPMGFRSTSVKHDQAWEDMSPYVPPLVYAFAQDRTVLASIRKILNKAENE
ncbi:MAG: hypothetical protein E6K17_03185 [Methanobacteriota archaeon]|nr:MAG: hypothetical protein E6K17_03185 [Euryarchaeota archaeon]